MKRIAVIAAAIFVALGIASANDPLLPGDTAAFDAAAELRSEFALDLVSILTDLGSFPAAFLAAALAAAYSFGAGRPRDAAAIFIGLIALLILVSVTKDLWERPRPTGLLASAGGFSYPSGHTAYATTWLAAAYLTGRRGLMIAAAVVLAGVGASRLYLHVHYLSDVVGGAALGIAVYAAVLTRR